MDLLFCLFAADFISGIGHWLEDTYFVPGKWTLFNKFVVEPNIGHHKTPYRILSGTYLETNRASILIALFLSILVTLCFHNVDWHFYLMAAIASQSNQVHKWAHTHFSEINNPVIICLQSIGLLQDINHHHIHHQRPYKIRYCIITNWLNPVLDAIKFWRGLEWIVARFGLQVKRGTPERQGY